MANVQLILVNPSLAISFLNELHKTLFTPGYFTTNIDEYLKYESSSDVYMDKNCGEGPPTSQKFGGWRGYRVGFWGWRGRGKSGVDVLSLKNNSGNVVKIAPR